MNGQSDSDLRKEAEDYGQKTGGHLYEELESFIASQPVQEGVEVYHQATLG